MLEPIIAKGSDIDIVLPDKNFAVLVVPKCGSSSFRKVLQPPSCARDEALQCDMRVSCIRHPVGRIISAWQYGWSFMPFADFWEAARADISRDVHFQPYTELIDGKATKIGCLEEFDKLWRTLQSTLDWFPRQYPHTNRSRLLLWHRLIGKGFEPAIKDILSAYKDDLNLWTKVYGS